MCQKSKRFGTVNGDEIREKWWISDGSNASQSKPPQGGFEEKLTQSMLLSFHEILSNQLHTVFPSKK